MRFGLFPAVGVAWYLSNEKFYGKGLSNILNKLKLRASLGRTPCYVRLGRVAVNVINDEKTYEFKLGKGVTLADGKDITTF